MDCLGKANYAMQRIHFKQIETFTHQHFTWGLKISVVNLINEEGCSPFSKEK